MHSEPVLERLARVEGRVEEHSRMVEDIAGRFTNLEARFDRLEASVNARLDHLDRKIDGVRDGLGAKIDLLQRDVDGRLTRYFTWMVGLTLASWLSLMFRTFPTGR